MGAGVMPWSSTEPGPGSRTRRRVRSAIIPAVSSDHAAIYCLLSEVFGGPSRGEFKASLEDPFYEPHDRLLLRRMGRIIAHVHLTHRTMQFGREKIPVAGLGWLAVAPNCRHEGLGTHLLQAAERQMAQSGELVGLLRTRIPHFFRRTGWALCGRHSSATASPHALLARLLDHGVRPLRQSKIHIRPWRRWEERGLARIYQQNLSGSFGPFERSRAYWHWLLERRAFDQLYVALDGPDLWDLEEKSTQIVGYASVRGSKIVEIASPPGRRRPPLELLARVCGDAIEQDRRMVGLCAPSHSPLMEVFDEAGGQRRLEESEDGEVLMARITDPLALLERLCGEFARRAEQAQLPRPTELGLLVDGRKFQVEIRPDGAHASADHLGRSYLKLNVADFTRLVLGQLDWVQALADGRLVPSTALARDAGRVLFPSLPLWRPPLDDLMRAGG